VLADMKQLLFLKGLSWLLILNLLIKPVWIFLIDRQVQNTVGHESYGSYFALLSLSYVLLFIADAGLSNYTTRQVAVGNKIINRRLLVLKTVLLGIYAITVCAVGWLTQVSEWNVLVLLILLQVAGSFLLFLRGVLAGRQLFKLDAFVSVADKLLATLLAAIFLYGSLGPITIETFLQIQIGTLLIVCTALFLFMIAKGLFLFEAGEKTKTILRQTAPFAVIILLMAAHYRADGFLLERLNGAEEAGIYAMAYRLLDAANMVGYLAASFLVPFFARNLNDREAMRKVAQLCTNGLVFLGIFVSCFGIIFASWIQSTLYHTNNTFTTQVIQLTLAVLPAYFLVHVYGSLLTAATKFKAFISILIVSVLTNLVLNFLLIPGYAAKGSAIASIVSQYFCALACYVAAAKHYGSMLSKQTGFVYLITTTVMLLLLFLLQAFVHSVWIILAVLLVLFCTVLALRARTIKTYVRSIIQ